MSLMMVTWSGLVASRYSVPSSRASNSNAVGSRLTNAKIQRSISSSSLAITQSNRLFNVSSAHRPALSLCVVITSRAPVIAAISRVRSLAPPTCPLSTETTFSPILSIQTTAGSSCLSLTYGAIVLTQIPIAPINTKASKSFQYIPTFSRLMILHSFCGVNNSLRNQRAIRSPSLLISIIAIFILFGFYQDKSLDS